MEHGRPDVAIGKVLSATWAAICRHPLPFSVATIGLAALDAMYSAIFPGINTIPLSFIADAGVFYIVVRYLLNENGLYDRRANFGSYLIVSLLMWTGFLLGLVLFVIPGLYLLGRWSLSPALVLARGMTARKALEESWHVTSSCVGKLLLLYAVCLTCWMVVVVGSVMIALVAENYGIAQSIESEPIFIVSLGVLVDSGVAASAYLCATVYERLIGNDRKTNAVFA